MYVNKHKFESHLTYILLKHTNNNNNNNNNKKQLKVIIIEIVLKFSYIFRKRNSLKMYFNETQEKINLLLFFIYIFTSISYFENILLSFFCLPCRGFILIMVKLLRFRCDSPYQRIRVYISSKLA